MIPALSLTVHSLFQTPCGIHVSSTIYFCNWSAKTFWYQTHYCIFNCMSCSKV